MSGMTPIEAARKLKELRERASPPRWIVCVDTCSSCRKAGREEYVIPSAAQGQHGQFDSKNDADFVAHAANTGEAVAQLALDAVEALEKLAFAADGYDDVGSDLDTTVEEARAILDRAEKEIRS